ncbi:MAG TPA: ABC transporter substrate-binding protein [bacterium]|nr:ABC transporter substrate-binding protein [bacterium]
MRSGLTAGGRKAWWASLVVALAVTTVSSGVGPASPAPGPARIVLSNDRDISNVDPIAISAPADYSVAHLVYSALVRVKPGTSTLEPDLAEKWEISPDGLVYTFHLRKGVKWQQNLGEVTADDVVAHFQRAASKESGSVFFNDLAAVKRIDAPDRYTVRFTLDRPSPAFLTSVIAYRPGLIVPKKIIETAPGSLKTTPVGSGPYAFSAWHQGADVILKANPDYYGGAPSIGEVDIKVVKDDQTALLALRRGEINGRYLQIPEVQRAALASPDVRVLRAPMPRTYYLAFNTTRPPFNDVRVRQALWYGLNRQGIVGRMFQGFGTFSDTMVPPTVVGSLPGIMYNYNPDRAKQLLKDAGFADGLPGKTFSLLAIGLQDQTDIAAVTQDNWRALGVNVNIEILDTPVFLQRVRTGNFDIMDFALLRTEPEQFLVDFFHSKNIGTTNFSRYDKADGLLDAMRFAGDAKQRIQGAQAVQRQLQRDAPQIPVLNPTLMLAVTPKVAGARLELLVYNVWQWSLPK